MCNIGCERYRNISNNELITLYVEDKNTSMKNEIVVRYAFLAKKIAERYSPSNSYFEKLYTVSFIALQDAVESYSSQNNIDFRKFVTMKIIVKIKQYLNMIYFDNEENSDDSNLIKKAYLMNLLMNQHNNYNMKIIDIAEIIGCSEEEIIEMMEENCIQKIIHTTV